MKKIRFGIIGLGTQGSFYAVELFNKNKIDNGELVALCDCDENKINIIKKKLQNDTIIYFDDYKKMIDSGLVDAVMVETPHYKHPEIVMECLKNNINVICDKPAGVYTKQVKEMNEFAKKCKAKFGMMFNQRTNCVYRKMKEMIANGDIGELQRVNWIITDWFRTQYYYNNGSWRATWKGEGGGVLFNQCPHQIDLVSWIVGKQPTAVKAFCDYGKYHNVEVEDAVTACFEYDNGATGVFITTTGEYPGTNRFEVAGTKGKLVCENNELVFWKNSADSLEFSKTATSGFAHPSVEKIIVETDGQNPQHAGIINNFANHLLGLEDLMVNGVDGLNGVELMDAMELSGWKNGARVTLPIDDDEYVAELNKHIAISKDKKVNINSVADATGSFGVK